MTSHNQKNYLNIIKEIFPHLQAIEPQQLTSEVLDLADLLLNELVQASKPFAYAELVFQAVIVAYTTKTPRELSEQSFELLMQLWNILNGKVRYQFIARTIALKWRSAFDLALMGL